MQSYPIVIALLTLTTLAVVWVFRRGATSKSSPSGSGHPSLHRSDLKRNRVSGDYEELGARDGGESCKPEGLRAGSAQQVSQVAALLGAWADGAQRWTGMHREHAVVIERRGELELRLRVGLSSRLPGNFVINHRASTPLPVELRKSFAVMQTLELFGRREADADFTASFLVSAAEEDVQQTRNLLTRKLRRTLLESRLPFVVTQDEVLFTERRPVGELSDTGLLGVLDTLVKLAEQILSVVGEETPNALGSTSDLRVYGAVESLENPRASTKPGVPEEEKYHFIPAPESGSFECKLSSLTPGAPSSTLRIASDLSGLCVDQPDGPTLELDLQRSFGAMLSYSWDVSGKAILHLELRQQTETAGRWIRLGISCRAESFKHPVHGVEELARRYPYVTPEAMLGVLARVRYVREASGLVW